MKCAAALGLQGFFDTRNNERSIMKQWISAALVAIGLGFSSLASAQDWKVTSAAQPGLLRDHHVRITNAIGQGSGGAIKTEFQFVGSEQEALQQVLRGRLQVGIISMIGLASVVPEAALLPTPYLWSSPAEADWVIDNRLLGPLTKLMDAKGLVLIGFTETGWTDVVGKVPLLAPADVKGRKIRVSPSPASAFFWGQVGANGVQLPLSELFPGLEQGLVEGADLPFVYYITTPAAKSAPNYTLTRHTHIFNAVVANKSEWDKLPPAQQAAIRKAMPTLPELRREVRAAEEPEMKKFEAAGGKVHRLSDEQRLAWYRVVSPGHAAYVEKMGPGAQQLYKEIQAAREEFAKQPK